MVKRNINVKHTFVTVAYMASQRKTYSSNTKKIVKVSINLQPKEGKTTSHLKNHQNQMSVPFLFYADFVRIIKPKTEKAGDKSELTSEHES